MEFHPTSHSPSSSRSCPINPIIFNQALKNDIIYLNSKNQSKGCFFMSFDGLFTRAMTNELSAHLKGGRLNKIHQPFQNELMFIIRANGSNHKLLISAHPTYARMQLTYENNE